MKPQKKFVVLLATLMILGVGAAAAYFVVRDAGNGGIVGPASPSSEERQEPSPTVSSAGFGTSAAYAASAVAIDPAIAKDFDVGDITNLADMEKAYGFTFTGDEKARLAADKFVVKNLLDTSIRPSSGGDVLKEFVQLYGATSGPRDPHERGPANAQFYSSDVFFHAYNNLFTELLKEMENKTFFPAMRSLSASFYEASGANLAKAATDADKRAWMKVRNYFAVPHAIFSTAGEPLTQEDYYKDGEMRDPAVVMAEHDAADATIDTLANATSFIKGLKLDAASEEAVLVDLAQAYGAKAKGTPAVFADEYQAYAEQTDIKFEVDFTQFTPRGTYASSSLRREYFRGMKWYIMVPFFLKSADLTTEAFKIAQLMAEHPDALRDYDALESAIGFMVGESDDLMPRDYLQALASSAGSSAEQAALDYLAKAHPPKIKDLAAQYATVGTEQSDEVRLLTMGMRFFSGKFIIDSGWTGFLTQGDEAPRPGYTQKLPPMASALEVMTLLGSDYAKSKIPTLDFYGPGNSKAIDQAMAELAAETERMTDTDWTRNLYTSWLWTIRSLFGWQEANRAALPRFMQSALWEVKTLRTAAAFWTELRHATILYAKQSFAELGAGGPPCDERPMPPPPKAYIEPQAEAFARLSYLAKRTNRGLKELGYELRNMTQLENFIALLDTVQSYVRKELGNETLDERISPVTGPDFSEPSKTCAQQVIEDGSDWEALRLRIVDGLNASIPVPTEGPIMSAKDRRTALVADVHTGGDSDNPTRILYEGTGVPSVIFTAVSDANGPRLTVGFISSHYEFTRLHGGNRLTDEEWQKAFYSGDDPYDAFRYTEASSWPEVNSWYLPLFGLK